MTATAAFRIARWVLFVTAGASFYFFVEAVHFQSGSVFGVLGAWLSGQAPAVPVDWTGLLSSAFLFPMTYALSPLLLGTVHGIWSSAAIAYPGMAAALVFFAIGARRRP